MILSDLQLSQMLLVAAIFGLAAMVQAVTGFGFALLAVPLLAVAVSPVPAVVATTALSLVVSGAIAVEDRHYIERRDAAVVSLAGVAGMPLGLWIITAVSDRLLTAVIAVVLLVSTLLVMRGLRLPKGGRTEVAVGAASGAMLTSTGMNGPPLVVAFQAQGMPPRRFRGTLSAVFVTQGAAALVLFAALGQIDGAAIDAVIVGLPMLAVGWWVGNRAFHVLAAATFRRLVLLMMIASALVAFGSALAG